jgi:hypothetical protein
METIDSWSKDIITLPPMIVNPRQKSGSGNTFSA